MNEIQHIVVGRHKRLPRIVGRIGMPDFNAEVWMSLGQGLHHVILVRERNRSLLQERTGHNQGTGIKVHNTIRIHNSNSFLYLVD
jgi:hypothetical protein